MPCQREHFYFCNTNQNNSIINSKISMLQYFCEIWNPTHISKLQKCMYFMYHKCKCTYLFCLKILLTAYVQNICRRAMPIVSVQLDINASMECYQISKYTL